MLKRYTTPLVVAVALILAACSTVLPTILSPIGAVGAQTLQLTIKDEKALYVVEAGFKGVSLGLNAAVDAGLLKGERAAKAKGYYDKAYMALKLARAAYDAGNASSLGQQAAIAMDAIANLQAMLAPRPTS